MRKQIIKQSLSLLLALCMLLGNCTVGFAESENAQATVTTDENGIVTVTVAGPIESSAETGLDASVTISYYADGITETNNNVYIGNSVGETERIYEGDDDDTATIIDVQGPVTVEAKGTREISWYEWDEETQSSIPKSIEIENNATGINSNTINGNITINVDESVNAISEEGYSRGINAAVYDLPENETGASVDISVGDGINAKGNTGATGIRSTVDSYSENNEAEHSISIDVDGDISASSGGNTTGISASNNASNAEINITAAGDVTADGGNRTTGISAATNGENAETSVSVGGNVTAKTTGTHEETQYGWDEDEKWGPSGTKDVGNDAQGISASAKSGENSITVEGAVNVSSEKGNGTGVAANLHQYSDTPKDTSIEINIGDHITVQGETSASGLDTRIYNYSAEAEEESNRSITANVDGDISVSSNGNTTGLSSSSDVNNAETNVKVEGDVTANGSGETSGVTATTNGNDAETTITIAGDVTAEGGNYTSGVSAFTDGEDAETTITIAGDVTSNATGTHDVTVWTWDEEAQRSIATGTETVGNDAQGISASTDGGDIKIVIDGNVNVTSEKGASTGISTVLGQFDDDMRDNSISIDVHGNVTTSGVNHAGGIFAHAGMNITDPESGDEENDKPTENISIAVDGDISAKAENSAFGVTVGADGIDSIDIDVGGSISADAKTALGLCVDVVQSDATINVGGDITSSDQGILIASWKHQENELEDGGSVQIIVGGDVTAGSKGLNIEGNGNADINVLIEGTLKSEKEAVVIEPSETAENVTLTVWKIEPNEAGEIARVGGDVAVMKGETAEPAETEQGEQPEQSEQKENAAEAFAKTINYIIKLQESEGADLSVDGATVTKDGLYTAHEDDTVTLKITLQPGYLLINAFNNDMVIQRAADGNYYVTVPRGGGVLLSVKAGQMAQDYWDDYAAPLQVSVVKKPKKQNNGNAASKETDAILSSGVLLSEQTNAEGITEWTLDLNMPKDGFSDGLVITADLPTVEGVAAELVSTPVVSGLYENELCRMDTLDNQLVFSFYKQYENETHNEPGLNAGARKVQLAIQTKPAESWPEGATAEMTMHAEAAHQGTKYQFDVALMMQDGSVLAKWEKNRNNQE